MKHELAIKIHQPGNLDCVEVSHKILSYHKN